MLAEPLVQETKLFLLQNKEEVTVFIQVKKDWYKVDVMVSRYYEEVNLF